MNVYFWVVAVAAVADSDSIPISVEVHLRERKQQHNNNKQKKAENSGRVESYGGGEEKQTNLICDIVLEFSFI